MRRFRNLLILGLACMLAVTAGCQQNGDTKKDGTQKAATEKASTAKTPEPARIEFKGDVAALVKEMTLEEKIGQMVQAERETAAPESVKKFFLGSVFSGGGSVPGNNTPKEWLDMCTAYQEAAKSTRLGIPILYGVDAVHGHNNLYGSVVFPHNIGLGAAADLSLMSEIGGVTAKEMIATGVNWTFAPCVAAALDIRWGRTYESYGQDPALVSSLAVPYITALQEQYGIAATAKHFIGDGAVSWGTGDRGYPIDEGDVTLSEEELRKTQLPGFQAAIKAGVKSIMISYSSWNGKKSHENAYLINDVLKGELGFTGFVVSDSEAIHQIKAEDLYHQVVLSVNSGVDMFMEPEHWIETLDALKTAVQKGDVKQERVDDAVSRILKVKWELGLFENPLGNRQAVTEEVGAASSRDIARKAVRESLVLLKNKNQLLPLKKSAKLFITGPAANDIGAQCGGWTKTWQGGLDMGGEPWTKGTTILEGFKQAAEKNGGVIITDVKEAKKADAAVVVIGETPYAEGHGDDGELGIFQGSALEGNKAAIDEAKSTGLPVIVIIVSGRPRIITKEMNAWNAVVEAWLPGTEGGGVAEVLYGDYDFQGKLPFAWPKSMDQLPVSKQDKNHQPLFPVGFGLKMNP